MQKDSLKKYLSTRAVSAPWIIEGCDATDLCGAVVIPALSESKRLFYTLDSLAANPPELLARFLVLVVVNHREDATAEQKQDNYATLKLLRQDNRGLQLAVVDAASAGRELPAATGGVGLARKMGMDLALPRLKKDGILVCLDADTLVDPEYLGAITAHFKSCQNGGAVIPFRHQRGASPIEERAITLYELFLRHYVLGLELAGSPYAFHTVGSAMACSVPAYLGMGGMNSRSAGEDFYFLQQLKRTAGITQISGSTVLPSARSSWRVPFGTGKSISRLVAEGEEALTFYRMECFDILQRWLQLVEEGTERSGRYILSQTEGIHPELTAYLAKAGFTNVWERLRANCRSAEALRNAFHGWFDALKTVRLMHHLSVTFPRCRPADTLPELLSRCGHIAPNGESAQLELLRSLQY